MPLVSFYISWKQENTRIIFLMFSEGIEIAEELTWNCLRKTRNVAKENKFKMNNTGFNRNTWIFPILIKGHKNNKSDVVHQVQGNTE